MAERLSALHATSMPNTWTPPPAHAATHPTSAGALARRGLIGLLCALCLNAQGQAFGSASDVLQAQKSGGSFIDGADSSGSSGSAGNQRGDAETPNTPATVQLHQSVGSRLPRGADQFEPSSVDRAHPPHRAPPSEFERFVNAQLGEESDEGAVHRFGAELMTDPVDASEIQDPLPSVPGDYVIRAGDEIVLNIWGTVDADLRLVVDREGRISIPRVGTVPVAGLRHSELAPTLQRYVSQVFKGFQLSATLGQVRAIRIFVSGYAQRRGSITVNGLSSVLHAIMRAGGPSAAGSFRDIRLYRKGEQVASFDLYDMLLKGRRDADLLVQPDDVIFIGPVGKQVALVGSVNEPAIFELKPGENFGDVLRMAGGFDTVADDSRIAIEHLADRPSGHVTQLPLPAHADEPLENGDLIRVLDVVTAKIPLELQNERVRVQGEVLHPGVFILPPGSHVADALRAAGGMTPGAYPFGTEFTRESVRSTQQQNYRRALQDLETDMTKAHASVRATSAEEQAAQAESAAANTRLIQRLRAVKPTGRIVLDIDPDATSLPDIALESGDVITIPPRTTSVGVFGSVFSTGNFFYMPGHTTRQYLARAGGPTRGADKDSIFMVRANGSVVSARQGASFWHSNDDFDNVVVEPGDTIFVPEEINKSTLVQNAKDWTQILYQFGLGVAGIKTLGL
ncbi:MAG TPA: SLBB domain-containing protein [Burkholderiaceae bacterium]